MRAARAFWERADTALRTGGVLASAHDQMQASLHQHRQAAARQVSAARQACLGQADDPAHAFTFEDESNGGQPKPPEFADLPLINLILAADVELPADGDSARPMAMGSPAGFIPVT